MSEETKNQILNRRALRVEPDFLWGNPRVIVLGKSLVRPRFERVEASVPEWNEAGAKAGEKNVPALRLTWDGELESASITLLRLYVEQFAGMLTQYLHFHPSDMVVRMADGGEGMDVDIDRPERSVVEPLGITRQLGIAGGARFLRFYFRNDEPAQPGAIALAVETPTKWMYLVRDALLFALDAIPAENETIVRLRRTDMLPKG